jgi:TatD-related deoxyribonuclease
MKSPKRPVTDDHIHIDPVNGQGLEAAKDFQRSGGTHLFLVSKPSSSFGIVPRAGRDFSQVFDRTVSVAESIRGLGIMVFVILGVHPAEMTRLADKCTLEEAEGIMEGGLSVAADYIRDGRAVALKSGRPHYETSPEVLDASNRVLSHAFSLAADLDCAVQVHAESGPCADMLELGRQAGLNQSRIVKHYATPDTPLTPSMIATHPEIPLMASAGRLFTMESDYMDENSRPGAVLGPKSVPRATLRLLSAGLISEDDAHRIHQETPERVYGVNIQL